MSRTHLNKFYRQKVDLKMGLYGTKTFQWNENYQKKKKTVFAFFRI